MRCPYRQVGSVLSLALAAVAPLAAADFTVNVSFDGVDAVPGDGFCRTTDGSEICPLRAATKIGEHANFFRP